MARLSGPMMYGVLGIFCSVLSFGQSVVPGGTVLPVELGSSLSSAKSKFGQIISARVMQDVPLSGHQKIRAGTKVFGRVLAVHGAGTKVFGRVLAVHGTGPGPAQITFSFDQLKFAHQSRPINTQLRALASMMAVEDAQVPPSGPDRGTPWAWTTRNLIGGEVAYGDGGPVASGTQIVGRALTNGVLVRLRSKRQSGCDADSGANEQPQATWVFSSDACGVYGIPGLQVAPAATNPSGQITLTSSEGNVNLRRGSGMLLQITKATR